jgi:CDP-paratose 2-epimerase
MRVRGTDRPVLITGGAGFVGANLAHALLADGVPVRILDDLSRRGVEANLSWLAGEHRDGLDVIVGSVTDAAAVRGALRGVAAVFHLAAQVAVTSSIDDPHHDFRTNLIGTLNVLEANRALPRAVPLVFTSTNKVYGELDRVDLVEAATRYQPAGNGVARHGVDETMPLDFRSPYGCSKGAADQYVLDFARTYGLPAVVFRMSCIYGPHQFGNEDQGWVAHFVIRALEDRPITIYGDGKQVRDVLFVDDLVEALRLAAEHADRLAGRAFNIGGGPHHATSLLELLALVGELEGRPPRLDFAPWRLGDQRHYVSDPRRFMRAVGWEPTVGVAEGVARLHAWLRSSRAGAAHGLEREPAPVVAQRR